MTRLMLVVEENFYIRLKEWHLEKKARAGSSDIVTTDSFQNLLGVLINVVLYV